MNREKFTFDELDIELILHVNDELDKRIGKNSIDAVISSGFLKRLHDNPIYVHHYDEGYWADYILFHYEKKDLLTI